MPEITNTLEYVQVFIWQYELISINVFFDHK